MKQSRKKNKRREKPNTAPAHHSSVKTGGIKSTSHRSPDHTRARFFTAICIFALTFSVFVVALTNQWVSWDDDVTLVTNTRFRGLGWAQLKWMFTTFYMGHYQPLSWVTFATDYLLWGMNPFGFHLTNVFLHSLNAVLVFILSFRLFSAAIPSTTKSHLLLFGAAITALLFSVHPLRVESVAWATQRRDVLSAFFLLSTVLLYLKAAAAGIGSPDYKRWLTASLAVYAVSLFAKAAGISYPLVLLILDLYPLRRLRGQPKNWLATENRSVIWEKAPYFLLASIFAALAILAQHEYAALKPVDRYGITARIAQSFFGIAFYLWKTVWPFRLSPLYELPVYLNPLDWPFIVSALVVGAISIAVVLLRHRLPAALAAWLCYLAILFPVLGIAQSGPQLAADRYTYLSCVGPLMLLGWIFLKLWQWSETRSGVSIISTSAGWLLVLGLAGLAWQQVKIWHDSERLWRHAVQVSPNSFTAHYNLGIALAERDQNEAAEQQYRQALEILPQSPDANNNLGQLLARRGKFDEAIERYQEALRNDRLYKKAYNNLAAVALKLRKPDDAINYFRQVLQIDPHDANAHFNLAAVLADRGDRSGAAQHYQAAAEINPTDADAQVRLADFALQRSDPQGAVAHLEQAIRLGSDTDELNFKLGTLLALQGKLNEAAQHFERALQTRPEFAEAHLNLGRIRAAQGDLGQAVGHFRKAIELQPDSSSAHETLAVALAEQGQREEALKHHQESLRLQGSPPER
jgi:protein O-mannosyl-transferase